MLTKKSKTLQSGAVFCALSRDAIFNALAFFILMLFAFFDENEMMCRYAQFGMDYRMPSCVELVAQALRLSFFEFTNIFPRSFLKCCFVHRLFNSFQV